MNACMLSILNSARSGGEWSNSRLAALPPVRYPLTPTGQVAVWIPEPLWSVVFLRRENFLPLPGFELRTLQR